MVFVGNINQIVDVLLKSSFDGAISAVEHAILSVIPDAIIYDARDISGFSYFRLPF